MSNTLPPIPNEAIGETHSWREWFLRVRQVVANPSATIFHNLLGGLQGGDSSNRIHLTTGQVNALGGSGSVNGYLRPQAGTTAAGTAPIKLTAGSLLTTPESGTFEYNNSHLYFTDGDRHAFVQADTPITATTTVANTVTETTLFSYTVNPNELHNDEVVKIELSGFYSTASAAESFTLNYYLGSTLLASVMNSRGNNTNAGWKSIYELTTRSVGVSGTLIDFADYSDNSGYSIQPGLTTTAIDTTTTNTLTVKIVWTAAKAGNTFSLTQGRITFTH